jgi:hypothetical protein
LSWPVTTRRMVRLIGSPPLIEGCLEREELQDHQVQVNGSAFSA